jgi:hypothetical protein
MSLLSAILFTSFRMTLIISLSIREFREFREFREINVSI